MLSGRYIEYIYGLVKNIPANKYVPLPPNDKNWKWEKKDFPRVIALLEFKELMEGKTFDKVVSFNGATDPEYEYLVYNSCTNYDYPEYDLHNLALPENNYDFAMVNQTIEHLYCPVLALKNIYKHLSSGAMIYANVPVNNIPHGTPLHFYTGITTMGLGVMMALAGFEIVSLGQWGNKIYFKQMFDSPWSDYTYCENPGYNDIECPIITWCLAIKR